MADPASRSWRTSKTLLLFTATLGLFTENFLYGFVVPIMPYMIEKRLGLDPAYTQRFTTELLFILGLISVPAAPIIGHFADKTTSRKVPLLIALVGCTIGTLLVATTLSIWAVYLGRVLQGISGTGAWIVGFAMLTDAAGSKHMGKALGFAGSFITAGIITGPAISGVLLQWLGYWAAWSVPLGLLLIDFVARLAMIEEKKSIETSNTYEGGEEQNENAPLLDSSNEEPKAGSPRGFYSIILTNGSAWAAMFNVTAFALILSGFDATLPLHLRDTFGWGPAPIGSIFLGLQIPSMCLAPFVGWLRDRIGLRWPTTIGWALTAPLLWFSGVPGNSEFLGIGDGRRGQGVFIATIIAIGICSSFVRGAGTFQLTSTMHELKAKDPNVFGPGGGSSRIFSLTELSFNVGLMLGPVVCGSISGAFGFYYTACTLAAASAFVATTSFIFFTHKSAAYRPEAE
ncbi:Putative major facilitator superfamily, MFS transporter superfamily [Septoria linicola]|uniref:Major facilitator superfamily, MFS transporter superfamily n=1 Tax=Septoria linicola TaxID=215465 RepID=A0A9Q9B4W8_9PEZI|nr:Putative major facilitator superfamily, MFS transporter superfamily [Septoria linicola]